MILLKSFKNIFSVPELRKKLFFTLGVLIVYRVGMIIPVAGVNIPALADMLQKATGLGGILSHMDLLSGGALGRSTIFALGIGPYISASIMMQLLGMAVPYFEQLLKEGEYGRKIINQYTRYLTVLLGIVWSSSYSFVLERNDLVLTPGWGFRILFIISLTAGALFVMWLSEQISQFGIGNGSSMIIFAGIVSRFPSYVPKTLQFIELGRLDAVMAILVLAAYLMIMACIVYLEKGERKIPVQYARRVVGNRVYGGQSTYIPFKINPAGVMPVIFASSVLLMPMQLAAFLSTKFAFLADFADPRNPVHMALEFILIIFFSFFYTSLIFNPDELAENMKKNGGFVPGIRPGRKTSEYFNYLLTRIGLVGALYLAILDLLPNVINSMVAVPFYLGGTSLLIVVGVALETLSQIESYLIEHRYEGFLSSGRMRGRLQR